MPTNETIKNCALLEFDLCGKKRIIESNEVEAKIIKIDVIKQQDCDFVLLGDKIEYTIKICNSCNVKVCDIEVVDSFSEDAQYIHGSFKVNGYSETPSINGHTLRYHINELNEGEEMLIKFEVRVD